MLYFVNLTKWTRCGKTTLVSKHLMDLTGVKLGFGLTNKKKTLLSGTQADVKMATAAPRYKLLSRPKFGDVGGWSITAKHNFFIHHSYIQIMYTSNCNIL